MLEMIVSYFYKHFLLEYYYLINDIFAYWHESYDFEVKN